MDYNPWLVDSIKDFWFLNCPECNFKAKEEEHFQKHAINEHSFCRVLFKNSNLIEIDPLTFNSTEKYDISSVNELDASKEKEYIEEIDIKEFKVETLEFGSVEQFIPCEINQNESVQFLPIGNFNCKMCDKEFQRKYHLKRHIATVHEKKKPYVCPQCNNFFGQQSVLNKHIISVHERTKRFKCELCEFTSSDFSHLKQHVSIVHEKKTPHKCPHCSKSCSTKGNLSQHISSVHNLERAHKCEICEATFKESRVLRRHKIMTKFCQNKIKAEGINLKS